MSIRARLKEMFPGIEDVILDQACNQVDINAATEFVISGGKHVGVMSDLVFCLLHPFACFRSTTITRKLG